MKTTDRYKDKQDEESWLPGKAGRITPFKVPEGYFETLPSKITDRISVQTKSTLSDRIMSLLYKPQYSVSLLLVLFAVVFTFFRISSDPLTVENITNTEVVIDSTILNDSYFIAQFDESEIIGYLLDESDIAEYSSEEDVKTQVWSDTGISKNVIIEYLLENNDIESELLNN